MAEEAKRLVKLVIDADAAALLLKLAGGPRKQGDYVSKLIRAADATHKEAAHIEDASVAELRLILQGLLAALADVQVRLGHLEQKQK